MAEYRRHEPEQTLLYKVVAAELGDEPAPDVSVLLRKSIQLLGRAR